MIYSIFLCRNLDYVQIPESLTYIEQGTFDYCGFWVNLTDIKGYTTSRTNSSITLSWKKILKIKNPYEVFHRDFLF